MQLDEASTIVTRRRRQAQMERRPPLCSCHRPSPRPRTARVELLQQIHLRALSVRGDAHLSTARCAWPPLTVSRRRGRTPRCGYRLPNTGGGPKLIRRAGDLCAADSTRVDPILWSSANHCVSEPGQGIKIRSLSPEGISIMETNSVLNSAVNPRRGRGLLPATFLSCANGTVRSGGSRVTSI